MSQLIAAFLVLVQGAGSGAIYSQRRGDMASRFCSLLLRERRKPLTELPVRHMQPQEGGKQELRASTAAQAEIIVIG